MNISRIHMALKYTHHSSPAYIPSLWRCKAWSCQVEVERARCGCSLYQPQSSTQGWTMISHTTNCTSCATRLGLIRLRRNWTNLVSRHRSRDINRGELWHSDGGGQKWMAGGENRGSLTIKTYIRHSFTNAANGIIFGSCTIEQGGY